MSWYKLLIVSLLAAASAFPTDPVIYKLDTDRFHYITDDGGTPHLVDLWVKASDLKEIARFNPDTENHYHLFTRSNPSLSQVIAFGSASSLTVSNFVASKRTAVIIHGWISDATSPVNTVLVPAFLAAEDMNVIVVDWKAGAGTINYVAAVANTVSSGESVAKFISWVNSVSGANLTSYHIAGHSLGGHQAGVVGRNLGGQVPYITALDPAMPGWITNEQRFKDSDSVYTEVIHTNAGIAGFITPLGNIDFYPNGGVTMPGCSNQGCDHDRAFHYFAESITSGGFTGKRCDSYWTALAGTCDSVDTLKMGGITPKTGQTGVFFLETNAAPPFSKN